MDDDEDPLEAMRRHRREQCRQRRMKSLSQRQQEVPVPDSGHSLHSAGSTGGCSGDGVDVGFNERRSQDDNGEQANGTREAENCDDDASTCMSPDLLDSDDGDDDSGDASNTEGGPGGNMVGGDKNNDNLRDRGRTNTTTLTSEINATNASSDPNRCAEAESSNVATAAAISEYSTTKNLGQFEIGPSSGSSNRKRPLDDITKNSEDADDIWSETTAKNDPNPGGLMPKINKTAANCKQSAIKSQGKTRTEATVSESGKKLRWMDSDSDSDFDHPKKLKFSAGAKISNHRRYNASVARYSTPNSTNVTHASNPEHHFASTTSISNAALSSNTTTTATSKNPSKLHQSKCTSKFHLCDDSDSDEGDIIKLLAKRRAEKKKKATALALNESAVSANKVRNSLLGRASYDADDCINGVKTEERSSDVANDTRQLEKDVIAKEDLKSVVSYSQDSFTKTPLSGTAAKKETQAANTGEVVKSTQSTLEPKQEKETPEMQLKCTKPAKAPIGFATSSSPSKPIVKKQATLQSLFFKGSAKSTPTPMKEERPTQSPIITTIATRGETRDASKSTIQTQPQSKSPGVIATSASSSLSFSAIPTAPQKSNAQQNPDPIIASFERAPSNVEWTVQKDCLLVRNVLPCTSTSSPNSQEEQQQQQDASPRSKVAGFDLDQTLVQWRCSGWPSRPEHYELWNSGVAETMRRLHDEGYKLVIFSNQGGIRGAFNGKTAARVKGIIDWIAKIVDRPLFAVCSTKKDGGYHKGAPGMWGILKDCGNGGKGVDPSESFFVGDSDGTGSGTLDPKQQQYQQAGVDKLFAENVGMKFFNPSEFFGVSNMDRRRTLSMVQPPPSIPKEAMDARAALLGGYLRGPILLMLCGVQGSGKSTFSKHLVDTTSSWCHYSQDTIRNGRPGDRKAVEKAVITALDRGNNVVVDRMHLDPTQRAHFLEIGREYNVPVHALVMMASESEVHERVLNRINHPGKVEGVNGARIAVASLARMVLPKYDESFELISFTNSGMDGNILNAYQRVTGRKLQASETVFQTRKSVHLPNVGKDVLFPMISFGTMSIGKRATSSVVTQAIKMGCQSVDTAPTYKNEDEVGSVLSTNGQVKVTIKVPKRVNNASQAREEVVQSLSKLQRDKAHLVLLHWPSDLIEAGTLASTWRELEEMKKDGLCDIIGVSNFSISALELLLSDCVIKPAINQVERHPLLPQYDLMEYCLSQGIVIQAHSPLGHGSAVLLENETILRISEESKNLSPAQVLLSWNLQQGVPIVVKFSGEEHGKEVMAMLDDNPKDTLIPEQMRAIHDISAASGSRSHRFVNPPFMYRPGAVYSWGDSVT